MNSQISDRQHLIEVINTLPPEAITELSSFVDYLRYKTAQQPQTKGNDFLMAIAGLGALAKTELTGDNNEITHQNHL